MLPPKTRNGNHPACIGSGIISPGYLPRPLPSRAGSMNDYLAWFDGACEPVNPRGTASFGVVIKDNAGTVLVKEHGIAGKGSVMSNKLAEYSWSRVPSHLAGNQSLGPSRRTTRKWPKNCLVGRRICISFWVRPGNYVKCLAPDSAPMFLEIEAKAVNPE